MKDPNRRPHTRSKKCGFENMTPEQLAEAQAKGHAAKKANGELRKTLREELLLLLSEGNVQERMSLVLIDKVLAGGKDAIEAYKTIRDSIGEKMPEKVDVATPTSINIVIDDSDDDKSNDK